MSEALTWVGAFFMSLYKAEEFFVWQRRIQAMSENLLKKIVKFVSEYAYRIRAKQIHKANFTSLDDNGTTVAFKYFDDDGIQKYEKWDIDTLMENYSLGSTN